MRASLAMVWLFDGMLLVLQRLDDHEVGEVRHQYREEHRENDHGAGEPLAQGHASQHCVRSVGADGPGRRISEFTPVPSSPGAAGSRR